MDELTDRQTDRRKRRRRKRGVVLWKKKKKCMPESQLFFWER